MTRLRTLLLSAATAALPTAAQATTVCDWLAQSSWHDPSAMLAALMGNGAIAAILVSDAVRRQARAAEARWRAEVSERVKARLAQMREDERETEEALKAKIAARDAAREVERLAKAFISTMGDS